MIRTLTLVFVVALLGGAAAGFFAKEALGTRSAATPSPARAVDPRIEQRLRLYRDIYQLGDPALGEVRRAHEEYYRDLDVLLQHLRLVHAKEFSEISTRFHARVDPLLPDWKRK